MSEIVRTLYIRPPFANNWIMDNWVILFVRTGTEEELVVTLRNRLNAKEYFPFFPAKELPYKTKGIFRKVRMPLFPGYLFIKTAIEPQSIAGNLKAVLREDDDFPNDIFRLLHYGKDKNNVVVRESERIFWENLLDADFCIGESKGIIEGDRVRVVSGPLVGREGLIKRIDRHKRKAIIESEMMGSVHRVMVMLEVVGRE